MGAKAYKFGCWVLLLQAYYKTPKRKNTKTDTPESPRDPTVAKFRLFVNPQNKKKEIEKKRENPEPRKAA